MNFGGFGLGGFPVTATSAFSNVIPNVAVVTTPGVGGLGFPGIGGLGFGGFPATVSSGFNKVIPNTAVLTSPFGTI